VATAERIILCGMSPPFIVLRRTTHL
jgi:hypothetical protein